MKRGKRGKKIRGIGDIPHILTGLKALATSGAKYLIVGGIAANLHGLSRGTKDIDILIPKEMENTGKILKGLENLLWGLSREITPEEVLSKPFTIIGDTPRVDLLLRAGKLKFDDAYPNRIERVVEGIKLSFVSLEDLIHSKQTGRPQDDLEIREIRKLQKIKSKL